MIPNKEAQKLIQIINNWIENSKARYIVLDYQEYSLLIHELDINDDFLSPNNEPIGEIGTPI